jgi:hypothetical protein
VTAHTHSAHEQRLAERLVTPQESGGERSTEQVHAPTTLRTTAATPQRGQKEITRQLDNPTNTTLEETLQEFNTSARARPDDCDTETLGVTNNTTTSQNNCVQTLATRNWRDNHKTNSTQNGTGQRSRTAGGRKPKGIVARMEKGSIKPGNKLPRPYKGTKKGIDRILPLHRPREAPHKNKESPPSESPARKKSREGLALSKDCYPHIMKLSLHREEEAP